MSLLNSKFHRGNIFENLADFLLGSLGNANPPRGQYDHGYDFYCYLSEPAETHRDLLKFDFPYNIQIKSGKGNSVKYGNDEYQKWKKDDISWLFKHETPFFIGILDTEDYALQVYDTTGIWQLYVNDQLNCSQVKFNVGGVSTDGFPLSKLPANFDYLSLPMRNNVKTIALEGWEKDNGDGLCHIIDMGNPIIKLSVEDTKDQKRLESIKLVLKTAIELERNNITNRNMGINFFSEIKNNITNDPNFFKGSAFKIHPTSYSEILKPHPTEGLISLLINAEHYQDTNLKTGLKEILKLLPSQPYYEQLYKQYPQLFDWVMQLRS